MRYDHARTVKLVAERGATWRALYEAGESMSGLNAIEAARGHTVCEQVIQRGIIAAGGTLRTKAESIALREQRRMKHDFAAIEARRAAR